MVGAQGIGAYGVIGGGGYCFGGCSVAWCVFWWIVWFGPWGERGSGIALGGFGGY